MAKSIFSKFQTESNSSHPRIPHKDIPPVSLTSETIVDILSNQGAKGLAVLMAYWSQWQPEKLSRLLQSAAYTDLLQEAFNIAEEGDLSEFEAIASEASPRVIGDLSEFESVASQAWLDSDITAYTLWLDGKGPHPGYDL